jgi:Protein of unknown function (DUF2971)
LGQREKDEVNVIWSRCKKQSEAMRIMASTVADTIEGLANMPIPKKLWHYTDFNGFQGIVRSKRIYATHIRYLNDRKEFYHALDIAKEMLDEFIKGYPSEAELGELIPGILSGLFVEDGALSSKNLNVFTTSFTLLEDRLSQWRGYSKGSCGVSLGFDLRAFRPPEDTDTLATFARCVYEEAEKRDLIRQTISVFADRATALSRDANDSDALETSINEIMKSHHGMTYDEATNEHCSILSGRLRTELLTAKSAMACRLLRLMPLLKHSAFDEEQEWRFVVPVFTDIPTTQSQIKYRSRNNTLVPYIEYPLYGKIGDAEVLPLTDVIIGPGSEIETTIDAVRGFLESEGIKNVIPRQSQIPYKP